MLFTTYSFAALLAVTVAAYWVLPLQALRLALLLGASMVFYGWGHHWTALLLLTATIAINWAAGIALERRRNPWLLAAALAVDLGTLGWFKYSRFVGENLLDGPLLARPAGVLRALPRLTCRWASRSSPSRWSPTRSTCGAARSPPSDRCCASASSRASSRSSSPVPSSAGTTSCRSCASRRRFDPAGFHHGLFLLAAGLALKLGVADVFAQFAREGFTKPEVLTTTGAWTDLYAFAFQIYADFWGYSTMARRHGAALRPRAAVQLRQPVPVARACASSGGAGTSRSRLVVPRLRLHPARGEPRPTRRATSCSRSSPPASGTARAGRLCCGASRTACGSWPNARCRRSAGPGASAGCCAACSSSTASASAGCSSARLRWPPRASTTRGSSCRRTRTPSCPGILGELVGGLRAAAVSAGVADP